MRAFFRKTRVVLCLLILAGILGCGAKYYREDADREVYGIIQQKSVDIEGMPAHFTIEEAEPFAADEGVDSASRVIGLPVIYHAGCLSIW